MLAHASRDRLRRALASGILPLKLPLEMIFFRAVRPPLRLIGITFEASRGLGHVRALWPASGQHRRPRGRPAGTLLTVRSIPLSRPGFPCPG